VEDATFHVLTESESTVIGEGFGVMTAIRTAPNGNLWIVSLDQGTVHEVYRKQILFLPQDRSVRVPGGAPGGRNCRLCRLRRHLFTPPPTGDQLTWRRREIVGVLKGLSG